MLPHRSEVAALEVFGRREKLGRGVTREVGKRCRRDQLSSSWNVRRCVFHYEVKMAAFIDVVEKGDSSREKQQPDSSQKAAPHHPPKSIRTRWPNWWGISHSHEIWRRTRQN